MELQQKNFLNITVSYVTGSEPLIETPDWDEIYKLASIHSLSGMLYTVLNNKSLCDNSKIMNKLTGAFMRTVGNSVNQEIGLKNLQNLLNLHQIKHILFKGTVLSGYYPDKELRTMGDIDILIEKKDREKTHSILLEAGYTYDEAESHADCFNYTKNGVLFEMHTKITDDSLFEKKNYAEYTECFDNVFKYAELKEYYTYELNEEFHFIYLITHMAKHFKYGGCGLRMYIDIVMFFRHFEGKINRKYIKEQLKKLGLSGFTDSVFEFCNKWFGTNIPLFGKPMGSDALDVITDYVIAGGTFGYYDKNVDAIRVGSTDNSLFSKIKMVVSFIFPGYDHLKRRYDWMEKMPEWALPFAWIRYWLYRMFHVKQNNLKRIIQAAGSSDDAVIHSRLMQLIGLDDR